MEKAVSYETFIGLRYLRTKRKQTFISVISVISMVGIAIGVMALIVTLSLTSGFHDALRDKIIGVNAHILVLKYGGAMGGWRDVLETVQGMDEVTAVTPFIYSQVMLTSEKGVVGVTLRGLDPLSAGDVMQLDELLVDGDLATLASHRDDEALRPGIFLGSELSNRLGVGPGEAVTMVSPLMDEETSVLNPKMKEFEVAGTFQIGMYEYDSALALIGLDEAQRYLSMEGQVTGLECRIDKIEHTEEVALAIHDRLGFPYWTKDWQEMNRNFFSALELQKVTMFIVLALIVVVAAFNIVSTLIMSIMEKTRDIAILKTMGAPSSGIRKIFMTQGLLISMAGTAIGLVGGFLLCLLIRHYDFLHLDAEIYYLSHLPVKLHGIDFLVVSVAAIAVSLLATIYPSTQAARLRPVEALRYE